MEGFLEPQARKTRGQPRRGSGQRFLKYLAIQVDRGGPQMSVVSVLTPASSPYASFSSYSTGFRMADAQTQQRSSGEN